MRVSAVMAVRDAARFVEAAVRSALGQPELLELVAVDDGSTDGTADVLDRLAAEDARVRVVHQEGAGNVAAVNRAMGLARGELLALLDGDDAWPDGRLAAQLAVLDARPEVGLVYGDMELVDEHDGVLVASWLEHVFGAARPRRALELLRGNAATASSILLRARTAARMGPVPSELGMSDWWLAVRAAEVAEVAYVDGPRTRYRFHGGNIGLGAEGERLARAHVRRAQVQRWFLRRLPASTTDLRAARAAWLALAENVQDALTAFDTPFAPTLDVTPADRAAARSGADAAEAALLDGRPDDALRCALRAAATDPWCERAVELVEAAFAGPEEDPLGPTRPFVVALDVVEAFAQPALLTEAARAFAGMAHVTVALDASRLDPGVGDLLPGLVARAGADDLDLVAVLGPLTDLDRARLAARVTAVLDAAPGCIAALRARALQTSTSRPTPAS